MLIGRTVPSKNPEQFCNGAPFWWKAMAYTSKSCGLRKLKVVVPSSYAATVCIINIVQNMICCYNSGTGQPNNGIISPYLQRLHGKRLSTTQSSSKTSATLLCDRLKIGGICKALAIKHVNLFCQAENWLYNQPLLVHQNQTQSCFRSRSLEFSTDTSLRVKQFLVWNNSIDIESAKTLRVFLNDIILKLSEVNVAGRCRFAKQFVFLCQNAVFGLIRLTRTSLVQVR